MKPMLTWVAPPFLLEVFYERDVHRFRLIVTHGGKSNTSATASVESVTASIEATYEPIFGIDAADMAAINEKAEEMCRGLEA